MFNSSVRSLAVNAFHNVLLLWTNSKRHFPQGVLIGSLLSTLSTPCTFLRCVLLSTHSATCTFRHRILLSTVWSRPQPRSTVTICYFVSLLYPPERKSTILYSIYARLQPPHEQITVFESLDTTPETHDLDIDLEVVLPNVSVGVGHLP